MPLVRYDGPIAVTFPFGPAIPGEVRGIQEGQLKYYESLGFTLVESEDEAWYRAPRPEGPLTAEEIALQYATRDAEIAEAIAADAAAHALEAERIATEAAAAVESAPTVDESEPSPSTIVTDTE